MNDWASTSLQTLINSCLGWISEKKLLYRQGYRKAPWGAG